MIIYIYIVTLAARKKIFMWAVQVAIKEGNLGADSRLRMLLI